MALTSTLEKSIHRKGTKRFIDADPTGIILTKSGGSIVDGTFKSGVNTVRDSQRFKLIWSDQSGIVRETPNGTRKFDFVLVGEYDAEVEIGDTFSLGENKYVVTYVYPYNDYEVKAGGISHGPNPGNT